MGKNAFKLLYKEIKARKQKKTITYKELVLETDLIIRKSTKKLIVK